MAKKKRAVKKSEASVESVNDNKAVAPESAATRQDIPPQKKPKPEWRQIADFIVMLAVAVMIAVLIKGYVVDIYLIPSGSMETALHGRPDGGDRILCSKLNYRFRQPKRWEVAVFEFPYESARRSDRYNVSEQYRGQNFVKRVIGLPDEALAIYRGDIWVRPNGARVEYTRMVKPGSVQRGMWQNVYAEDFADVRRQELETFWNTFGDEVRLDSGGPLVLSPGASPVRLDYRPMIPVGSEKTLIELPGIPDRYAVRQPVQFRCLNKLADGKTCGHVFVKAVQTHNIYARCPSCGSMQYENAAVFYHRRSGLTTQGKYAVPSTSAHQGEDVQPRHAEYHFVPDLRVAAGVTPASEHTYFTVTLREDDRFVQAVFAGDGRVELRVNGKPSRAMDRALADMSPGKRHEVEFHIVEGTARIYVDDDDRPVLEQAVWDDKRSFPRNVPKASGVSLGAEGGDVALDTVSIDRDIFYYSGWEYDRGEKFAQMNSQGEVFINSTSFFPMGDHCPSSYDARSWGQVPLSLLRGPALYVWWPPERIGPIASP